MMQFIVWFKNLTVRGISISASNFITKNSNYGLLWAPEPDLKHLISLPFTQSCEENISSQDNFLKI